MPSRDLYVTDWGAFEIPEDVPGVFRKNGWFDCRYGITPGLRKYFSDMGDRLRDGKPVLTWSEWMARLTAKARKKLPKGDFAGPGRSFPIPDKNHAEAALRDIPRAKSLTLAQAQKIRAAAYRKLGK